MRSILTLCLLSFSLAPAQQMPVEIRTQDLGGGVHMLVGQGGNIGVSVGEDCAFLIDDQFAPLTKKIQEAVAKLSEKPIRFVVNTHWHGDHTGGNENLGKAGAVIIAHKNVRARMSKEQFMKAFNRTVPAAPKDALPVVTFRESVTLHLNGDEVQALHVANAHTDGDSIIHFKKANVVHMGDTFFNGMYPFIDLSSGGSIDGLVAAVKRALELMDEKTKVIPGHGRLSDKAGLATYLKMLETIRDRVAKLVEQRKSREEVVAAKPTADLDAKWGRGFINADRFATTVFDSLTAKK